MNYALQLLDDEETPLEDSPYLANLRAAQSVAPGDARVYTLLGEYLLKTKKPAEADAMFRKTLAVNRGEVNALEKVARRQIGDNDITGGFESLNILLTRWPARLPSVLGEMEKVLVDAKGIKAIIAELGDNPPWRSPFLEAMTLSPAAADYLSEIILGLTRTPNPPRQIEVRMAIQALMTAGKANAAYRVFTFTLPAAAQKLAGNVFNPQLTTINTGQVFDWEFQDSPGVEIARAGKSGFAVSLLNGPVRLVRFGQTLAMTPGDYVFKAIVSGQSLTLPRGLSLTVRCADARTDLAKIDLPEGQYNRMELTAAFTVPAEDCAVQRIAIVSGLTLDSWRFRYSGVLQLHTLDIEQAPQ